MQSQENAGEERPPGEHGLCRLPTPDAEPPGKQHQGCTKDAPEADAGGRNLAVARQDGGAAGQKRHGQPHENRVTALRLCLCFDGFHRGEAIFRLS